MRTAGWWLTLVAAGSLGAGCDEGGGGGAGGAHHHGGHAAGGRMDGGHAMGGGAGGGRAGADTYAPGLEKTGAGGALMTRLVEADPAPPDRGDNRWVVEILDLPGRTPRTGCDVSVEPRMPAHGHGTSVVAEVTAGDAPGHYVIEPVNLFMPGLWEITLGLTCGDAADTVVYRFWIEG